MHRKATRKRGLTVGALLARLAGVRRLVVGTASVIAWLAALPAGAQEQGYASRRTSPTVGGSVDARLVWVDRPPPVRLRTPGKGGVDIDGVPGDFVPRTSTFFAATVHASVYVAPSNSLVLPLVGLAFGAGGGGYADRGTFGAAAFDRKSTIAFGTLELPGFGFQTARDGWRAVVSVIPGIDFVTMSGHFHDASVDFDAEGAGAAFSLRAEARVCMKSGQTWLCATGAPTLVEGETLLDGGFFGVAAML
jgi:hypothetical protein